MSESMMMIWRTQTCKADGLCVCVHLCEFDNDFDGKTKHNINGKIERIIQPDKTIKI